MQLFCQHEQDVELAKGTEASGHFPEPASELLRSIPVNLQHRKEFAQSSRGDACRVDGANVAGLHAM
jgi:hypothetical protein